MKAIQEAQPIYNVPPFDPLTILDFWDCHDFVKVYHCMFNKLLWMMLEQNESTLSHRHFSQICRMVGLIFLLEFFLKVIHGPPVHD